MSESEKYYYLNLIVGSSGSGFISQNVRVSVCNLCGCIVGNIPAHDIICANDYSLTD